MMGASKFNVVTQTSEGPQDHQKFLVDRYYQDQHTSSPERPETIRETPQLQRGLGDIQMNPQKPAKPKPSKREYKSGQTKNSQIAAERRLKEANKADLRKRNIK